MLIENLSNNLRSLLFSGRKSVKSYNKVVSGWVTLDWSWLWMGGWWTYQNRKETKLQLAENPHCVQERLERCELNVIPCRTRMGQSINYTTERVNGRIKKGGFEEDETYWTRREIAWVFYHVSCRSRTKGPVVEACLSGWRRTTGMRGKRDWGDVLREVGRKSRWVVMVVAVWKWEATKGKQIGKNRLLRLIPIVLELKGDLDWHTELGSTPSPCGYKRSPTCFKERELTKRFIERFRSSWPPLRVTVV